MEFLTEYISRIDNILLKTLPDPVDQSWLNRVAGQDCPEADSREADAFLEPGRDLLRRGGKRWRPMVTILTCEALGGGRYGDQFAPLTEIPHNGSLIVDDIEDSSLTRRGEPSVHLVHGVDLSINIGNLMYFLPTIVLEQSDLDESTIAAVTRDWLAVMRRLHLGQGYDIIWHRNPGMFPEESRYLRMCRFKTGSLSSLAARLGARAAAAHQDRHTGAPAINENMVEELGLAWEDLGTAFQILDDVQNLSSGIPGKDRGDDIVEGKKSLPVIMHAAERPNDRHRLAALFAEAADNAPKGDWSAVEAAIELLESSGSIAAARTRGQALLDSGRGRLQALLPENEGSRLMMKLVEEFREKMV